MTRADDAVKTGRNWPTLLIGSTFLIPGLAISGWSMYSYMRESTNAPVILCAGASAAFDGIGLFAASKAHAFASKGRKAKFAWLIVWLAVFASVLINWRHASTQHWNQGIHVLISAPAAAAAAAFELMMQETREIERSQHEKRVRTRQSVKIDADIWIHHPLMVWAERRRESAQRLRDAIKAGRPAEAQADPAEAQAGPAEAQAGPASTVPDFVPDAIMSLPAARPGRGPALEPATVPTPRPGPAAESAVSAPIMSDANGARPGPAAPGPSSSERIDESQAVHIIDVVKAVYRDDWDTATITKVVMDNVPGANPETVRRSIGKARKWAQSRAQSGPVAGPEVGPVGPRAGSGNYL